MSFGDTFIKPIHTTQSMKTDRKEIGRDECCVTCPHCGKEYGRFSFYAKHIQEHKENGTIKTKRSKM